MAIRHLSELINVGLEICVQPMELLSVIVMFSE